MKPNIELLVRCECGSSTVNIFLKKTFNITILLLRCTECKEEISPNVANYLPLK